MVVRLHSQLGFASWDPLALSFNNRANVATQDPVGPGVYRSAGTPFSAYPQLARARPVVISDPTQWGTTVGPPPSLGSADYNAAWANVRSVGGASDSTRTQDQTDLVYYWRLGSARTSATTGVKVILLPLSGGNGNAWARRCTQLNCFSSLPSPLSLMRPSCFPLRLLLRPRAPRSSKATLPPFQDSSALSPIKSCSTSRPTLRCGADSSPPRRCSRARNRPFRGAVVAGATHQGAIT